MKLAQLLERIDLRPGADSKYPSKKFDYEEWKKSHMTKKKPDDKKSAPEASKVTEEAEKTSGLYSTLMKTTRQEKNDKYGGIRHDDPYWPRHSSALEKAMKVEWSNGGEQGVRDALNSSKPITLVYGYFDENESDLVEYVGYVFCRPLPTQKGMVYVEVGSDHAGNDDPDFTFVMPLEKVLADLKKFSEASVGSLPHYNGRSPNWAMIGIAKKQRGTRTVREHNEE